MAPLTPWSVALWALLPPIAVAVAATCRGTVADRLVAAGLTGALGSVALVLMSFAFDQQSYVSLAVALTVLGVPGALTLALSIERWL